MIWFFLICLHLKSRDDLNKFPTVKIDRICKDVSQNLGALNANIRSVSFFSVEGSIFYRIGFRLGERKKGIFLSNFFFCNQSVHVGLSFWICQVSIVQPHNFDLIHNLCNSSSSNNTNNKNCNSNNNNHFKMLDVIL